MLTITDHFETGAHSVVNPDEYRLSLLVGNASTFIVGTTEKNEERHRHEALFSVHDFAVEFDLIECDPFRLTLDGFAKFEEIDQEQEQTIRRNFHSLTRDNLERVVHLREIHKPANGFSDVPKQLGVVTLGNCIDS